MFWRQVVSQSPETAEDKNNPGYRRGWAKIFQMIRAGSSWSGHERNCAYLNTGDGNFANISVASGVDFADDGRGLAFGDWDLDGDLDFWISNRTAPRLRFMRNEQPIKNNFVSFQLIGNGKTTNRDAIGARVNVFTSNSDDRPISKTLRAGEGFLSQNSKWLHFGLGEAHAIEQVTVSWPGGESETFNPISINQRYFLRQGTGKPEPANVKAKDLSLVAKDQTPVPYSDQAILRLITPLALPDLPYEDWAGGRKRIQTQDGKPKLINLWASWCLPCLKELQEFGRDQKKIDQADIEILALSVDGINDDRSTPKEAAQQIEKMGFPFSTWRATIPLLNALQSIHDIQTPVRRPLPLPSSFLVDGEGELIAIYKGPVNVDQVLEDLNASRNTPDDRFRRAAIFAGRTLQGESAVDALDAMDALKHRKFFEFFQRLGQKRYAVEQLRKIVTIWPESPGVRTELASALLRVGEIAEAEASLKETLQIDPDYIPAQIAMAELLLKQNRMEDAIPHFDKAIATQQDDQKLFFGRGIALSAMGETSQSIEDFTRVTQLDPNFLPAFNRRGALYEKLGDYQRAQEDFLRAIHLNKDDPEAYNNLAWLQATCPDPTFRNGKDALGNAKKALALFSEDPFFTLDTLAAAYAESGNFTEAIKWQQKAIAKTPPRLAADLESRLQFYRLKQPYRQGMQPENKSE